MRISQHYQSIIDCANKFGLTMFVGKNDDSENVTILFVGDEEKICKLLFSCEAANWTPGTIVKANYELGILTLNSYMICQSSDDWFSLSYQRQLTRANNFVPHDQKLLRWSTHGWFTANGRATLIDAIQACGNYVVRQSRNSLFVRRKERELKL